MTATNDGLITSTGTGPDLSASTTEITRRSAEHRGDDDFQALPPVEVPDPARLILPDPEFPERHRHCGFCGEPVGRAYPAANEPAYAEGFCENCGEPFSFLPKLSSGERVGDRYDILGCFARGGQGWIYLATDTALEGQHVALKGVINTNDPAMRALAAQESKALVRLDHPNIVRVTDSVRHPAPGGGQDTYLVMEYVGGRSLRDLVSHGPPLRVEHVFVYGRAILSALAYMHGEGLLYCDMKPENVIHGDKRVKVIDLGATRSIGDPSGRNVGTRPYQVSQAEIDEHGLTVRSDLHTVGWTLRDLLAAVADPGRHRPVGELDALERVIARAVAPFEQRFAGAADMLEQLDGARREVLSLRDGHPRPTPSTLFEDTADLLDAELGTVPDLGRWVAGDPLGGPLDTLVLDSRGGAARLPVPRLDPADPAAEFIATAAASGPQRWLTTLSLFGEPSVELQLARARALVALGDVHGVLHALDAARDLLGAAAARDWRLAWHHGLKDLLRGHPADAAERFAQVRRAWPGEVAPNLALGFCAELRGETGTAERHHRAVWSRDHGQVNAAFGLARCHLRSRGRDAAVAVLDDVRPVSRHHDAARIAAVRIRVGRLAAGPPGPADLADAVRRLAALDLDGDAKDRMEALVREAALDAHLADGGGPGWSGGALLGEPVTEHGLRTLLEKSTRRLAERARDRDEHGVLVDRANSHRPKTRR
ncbi:serine/threonine-protein kinase [Actinokineospora pegani]|uniref:serine/threonine-protein kinase n=1 Tax=Actinokineospora pegani TaxID=2654637 RepID=UPI001F178579|nr:serine/threonine-protein kinase [Actinokineospora pegani]